MSSTSEDISSPKTKRLNWPFFALAVILLLFSGFYWVFQYSFVSAVLFVSLLATMVCFAIITSTITNRKAIILLILFYFLYSLSTFISLAFMGLRGSAGKVPFLGLDQFEHQILIRLIWPVLGSILFMIFFPRIFTPIYLKYKKIYLRRHKNVYLDISEDRFSLKKFLLRLVSVYLFTFGLANLLIPSVLDPMDFLPLGYSFPLEIASDRAQYYATFDMFFLLLPFSIALWSIGWTLEDAGLMHYRFPIKDSNELIVIEPIHYKYNTLLKGTAGFITIYYILKTFGVFNVFYYGTLIENLIIAIQLPLALIILTFFSTAAILPGYLLYFHLNKNFIRKGLKRDTEHFIIQELEKREELDKEELIAKQETRYFIVSIIVIAFAFLFPTITEWALNIYIYPILYGLP